jgi:hypothetical protein
MSGRDDTTVIRVYIRQGCHLCEQMLEQLREILTLQQLALVELCDVDSRHDWFELYDKRVPVLTVNDQLLAEYFLDPSALTAILISHEV